MRWEDNKYVKTYIKQLPSHFGEENAATIKAETAGIYQALLSTHAALPPKLARHAYGVIFPAAALYRALLEKHPEQAMAFMERGMAEQAARTGRFYARIVSLPGMRGLFLKIFAKGAKNGFGSAAGFEQDFLTESSRELAFNITRCPYQNFCAKLGCPELTHIFCKSDEYAYGALPGIRFIRTQTLGDGGELCDFRLYREY